MRIKTKRIIIAIQLVGLIILSTFVASILAGSRNGKHPVSSAYAEETVGFTGKDSSSDSYETMALSTPQQDIPSDYMHTDFTWSPTYPDVGEKILFRYNYYYYNFGELTFKFWSFGDGTIGIGSIVSHSYDRKGDYYVTLTVSGSQTYGSSQHYITVGASPFPKFTWSPTEPTTGENITFDASTSWDTNGKIVKYNWTYTDESEPDNVVWMGNNRTLVYSWDNQGVYKVKLAVTDDDNNTNEVTKTVVVSILRIDKVDGGFRHLGFQITNRGNVTANNVVWNVYANRNLIIMPLWRIFYKTGTINAINPGESASVDITNYRRGLGRITLTIVVEADNAVKITKSIQGSMLLKYIHLRS